MEIYNSHIRFLLGFLQICLDIFFRIKADHIGRIVRDRMILA